jgi:hypothetical protein
VSHSNKYLHCTKCREEGEPHGMTLFVTPTGDLGVEWKAAHAKARCHIDLPALREEQGDQLPLRQAENLVLHGSAR